MLKLPFLNFKEGFIHGKQAYLEGVRSIKKKMFTVTVNYVISL